MGLELIKLEITSGESSARETVQANFLLYEAESGRGGAVGHLGSSLMCSV